ncbi:hypothetical protein Q671_10705 [Halomonas sp. PBN3]|nr:hypothetical protein Q671_10705 [Halomonas sp. PBN3]
MYAFWLRRLSDFSHSLRTSVKKSHMLGELPDTEK